MSKPSKKKTLLQNRKQSQKQLHHTHQNTEQTHSFIPPTFPGEQVGVPIAEYRWFGQKIASLIQPRKP
jgi:hypothetical protein